MLAAFTLITKEADEEEEKRSEEEEVAVSPARPMNEDWAGTSFDSCLSVTNCLSGLI